MLSKEASKALQFQSKNSNFWREINLYNEIKSDPTQMRNQIFEIFGFHCIVGTKNIFA